VAGNFELYSEVRDVHLNRFPMSPVSTKYLRISVKDLTGLHGMSRTPWGFFSLRNENGRMDRWMDPSIKVLVKIEISHCLHPSVNLRENAVYV